MATPHTRPYWNKAAETYDQEFTNTLLGKWERDAVWEELGRVFRAGQRILELNCGTGVDAVHLAENRVRVLACDISPGMIAVARQRLNARALDDRVDLLVLPTEGIAALGDQGPFDGAFSNFSGLNMVRDLSGVARNLAALLKPGAPALLCLSGRIAPWDMAWYLAHGEWSKAFHRFKPNGVERVVDGVRINAYYPSIRKMARIFAPEFRLRSCRGIGISLPPTFTEPWARRYPRLFKGLAGVDPWLGRVPGLRALAGHVLFRFERSDG
jgi:SAM-dependent methyltransferase